MTLSRHSVPFPPGRFPWFRWSITFVVCVVLGVFISGIWRPPVERAIQELLSPYVQVHHVRVHSLSRLTLEGVKFEGGQAQALRFHFSIPTLMKNGPLDAVNKIELIEPVLSSFGIAPLSQDSPDDNGTWVFPVEFPSGFVLDIRDGLIFAGEDGQEWSVDGELLVNSVGDALHGTLRVRQLKGTDVALNRGWLDFECEVHRLQCSGRIEGAKGSVFHHELIDFEAHVTMDETGWKVSQAIGTGPTGNQYFVSAHGSYSPRELLDLTIETESTPVIEGLRWIGQDFAGINAARGSLFGTVQLHWRSDSLSVRGVGRIEEGRFADAVIDSATFRFETSGGNTVFSAQLDAGPGRLVTEEFRVEAGQMTGDIHLENFPVPTIARGVEGLGLEPHYFNKIGGRVNGKLQLIGSLATNLNTYLRLDSQRLSYQGIHVAPFEAEGEWNSESGWKIHHLQAHRIFATGEGASFTDFQARIHWDDLETEWVESLVTVDVLTPAPGISSGELEIQFDGTQLTGLADVSIALDTSPDPVLFQGEFTHSVDLAGSLLGTVYAHPGRAEFHSAWNQEGHITHISADLADLPAQPILPWVRLPAVDSLLSGHVQAWANGTGWNVLADVASPTLRYDQVQLENVFLAANVVSGSPDPTVEPCLGCMWGEASFTAQITPASAGQKEGSPLDIRLVLDGPQARLNSVTIGLFGGRVRVEGQATAQGEAGWNLDFHSFGHRLSYQNEGTTLDVDYSASLRGPIGAPMATGQVSVRRGDIDLLRLPRFGRKAIRAGDPQSGLARVGLNFSVDVRNVNLHARSLLDAEAEGTLEVKGVLTQPELYGGFEARRGMFRYGRTRFDLTEARASFHGLDLFPRLDVVGEARIDGRVVEAGVTGRADDISLSFKVDGLQDQQGALSLLRFASGENWDTSDWAGLGQALRAWLDEEFLSEAYWQLGRVLERALDVDRFRVEQEREDGDLRLNIGKYVTSDLYLSYRRSLLDPNRQDLGLEYFVSPGVRIHSRWFGEDGPDLGLEMQFPF